MKCLPKLSPLLISQLFAISLLFIGCNNENKPKKADPAFINYINAFTGDVVSSKSTIKLRLTQKHSAAKPGEAISEEVFIFKPELKGQAYWLDEQTIEYRPLDLMPSGQLYQARFKLIKLLKVPSKLEDFDFQFQVMQQSLDVSFNAMEAYSNEDLKWQKLKGMVLSYDFAERSLVEANVQAYQKGKALEMRWEHQDGGKIHRFIIDSVERKENAGEVMVLWDAKELGDDKEGEKKFQVPALNDFKVLDVKVSQSSEPSISINFSDPLNQDQDLTGLAYFQPNLEVKTIIEGNVMKLLPSQSVKGSYQLIISSSIKNKVGYQLAESFEKAISFESLKPAIEMIGDGSILPSSNGLIFPFKAVSLKAVNIKIIKVFEQNVQQFFQNNHLSGKDEMKRVGRLVYKAELPLKSDNAIDYGQWNNFAIDLSSFIEVDPGAIYRVVLSFDKGQSLFPCNDEEEAGIQTEHALKDDDFWDDADSYWYYYDFGNNDYYGSDYNYYDRNDPCKLSYYLDTRKVVGRNILASDLGIIAKAGHSNKMLVAITDLRTTQPLSGVEVELFNFQQQLMDVKVTDHDGFVEVDLNNKPYLLVAKQGKQRGYLRLDDGSALSLSMFDIGGQKNEKGLKGFVYGERGVWRPGDSLYLSFMLEDKERSLPENHPVVFELYTPQQQLYTRIMQSESVGGIYDFRTSTDQEAPTGVWKAKVKVGGAVFTKNLKIEAIKPNRLKIKIDFEGDFLSREKETKGKMQVKWLHGAIADGLKTDVEMKLSPASSAFPKYKDYSFQDQSRSFKSDAKLVFEGELDDNGQVVVNPKIEVGENAPGMLNAHFKIRAFEKGGDFSVDRMSIPFSPYKSYVGVKIPEGKGWNGALYSDKAQIIPIVTLDEHGNPVDRKGLKIEIYNIYWRWWWERSSDNDLAQYVSNKHEYLIKTASIDTKGGKAEYQMNLGDKYYGRKYIRIIDPESGHSTGQEFYVTYSGWGDSGENPGGAEMLTFTTDKEKYQVGDQIKVNIPAAKAGRILVSLESGSRIIDSYWVTLDKDQKSLQFKATEEMSPNVYIHLSLLQAHNQMDNDLPIRLFGVQPVFVENEDSHIQPKITMSDVLEPEKKFKVKVTEADGKAMSYTVAVVDDGLLDLTRFRTPAPWNHFNAKEALSVRTWDLYQYVMGAFTGKMAGLLAIGGDEGLEESGGAKANRFKPVVKFLGPFSLPANGTNEHEIEMPNYVGSVRTMVIAKQESAYGSSDQTSLVKKPLMVLATLPRVVGPGEKVVLPVTVFAMDDNIKQVKVEVETNNLLDINGGSVQNIQFDRPGDEIANFQLSVAQEIGIAKVKVKVSSGNESAYYDIELDVRAANPRMTNVIEGILESGEKWSSKFAPIGIKGTNSGVVEISSIPPLNLEKRLGYLIRYPHGCIEQTTSAVFAQLYLGNFVELNADQKVKTEDNIKIAINKLRSFQIYSGGFSYWPGSKGSASDWGTNYAGHFMIEAKAKGYTLPPGLLHNWIAYQKQKANNWSTNTQYYNQSSHQLTQAYRLYTLALAGDPVLGAMNRLRNLSDLSLTASYRLAAAYYLVGKKEIAEKLINNKGVKVDDYQELSGTYGSSDRDRAMILETMSLMDHKSEAKILIDELSRAMASNRWFSTQTTAYTLLAISKFMGSSNLDKKGIYAEYKLDDEMIQDINSQAAVKQINLEKIEEGEHQLAIENKGDKTLFVRLQIEGIPAAGDSSSEQNSLKMKLRYMDLDGKEIDPAKIKQGKDFMVEVEVQHPGIRRAYKEMALTQIFPSGWEIRNMRMDEGFTDPTMTSYTYQDIRDDRVMTYFDVNTGQKKTFRVLLNAAYKGEYYLPTTYCEAMYDHEINARVAGEWVVVE